MNHEAQTQVQQNTPTLRKVRDSSERRRNDRIVQWIEQLPSKQWVVSSNLTAVAIQNRSSLSRYLYRISYPIHESGSEWLHYTIPPADVVKPGTFHMSESVCPL